MKVVDLSIEGLKLVKPRLFRDERGFFVERYRVSAYFAAGIDCAFVQDNHSYSQRGVLRGMHFQRSPGQAKLVSVVSGEIFDVAVDIRPDSPTIGQWLGVSLNGARCEQLFLPVGFAHGFCVVSDEAHVVYKVSAPYDPSQECTFRYDDPDIAIAWPIDVPLLSEKDRSAPRFEEVVK